MKISITHETRTVKLMQCCPCFRNIEDCIQNTVITLLIDTSITQAPPSFGHLHNIDTHLCPFGVCIIGVIDRPGV